MTFNLTPGMLKRSSNLLQYNWKSVKISIETAVTCKLANRRGLAYHLVAIAENYWHCCKLHGNNLRCDVWMSSRIHNTSEQNIHECIWPLNDTGVEVNEAIIWSWKVKFTLIGLVGGPRHCWEISKVAMSACLPHSYVCRLPDLVCIMKNRDQQTNANRYLTDWHSLKWFKSETDLSWWCCDAWSLALARDQSLHNH